MTTDSQHGHRIRAEARSGASTNRALDLPAAWLGLAWRLRGPFALVVWA
jgi:hypothetical protein